jgi:hypothetical protein
MVVGDDIACLEARLSELRSERDRISQALAVSWPRYFTLKSHLRQMWRLHPGIMFNLALLSHGEELEQETSRV